MRLKIAICLLAFAFGRTGDRFKEYRSVESYEVQPGIVVTPFYSVNREVCKISIEKRHFSGTTVNSDTTMSKTQIMVIFDELITIEERGRPIPTNPSGVDVLHIDGDFIWKQIEYENVSLVMNGRGIKEVNGKRKGTFSEDRQGYFVAIITWNKLQCDAK